MIQNRSELKEYALQVCIPLMERTAQRRLTQEMTEINDNQGYFVSWIEGFCRPLWGMGPIIRSGDICYMNIQGEAVDAAAWIREVLEDAVNPESRHNWIQNREAFGDQGYVNQMKTELTSLLMGLYIARPQLWDLMDSRVHKKLADWIYEITEKAFLNCWANNHYWFCVLNFMILKKLGFEYPDTDTYIEQGLSKLNGMYVGNGWYQDGEFGRFDYYNPWAFHTYSMLLIWITEEDQKYEVYRTEFQKRTQEFLTQYYYWFDTNGGNIPFGRSLSYRYAASAVFPTAALGGCNINYGAARYAMLKNIDYYQNQKNLKNHEILPPGFLYSNTGVIENYTSDNGAYWCTKPFLALLFKEDHPFWFSDLEELPIEKNDFSYKCENKDIHILLEGNQLSGVTLYNNTINYYQHNEKRNFFNDIGGLYSKFAYNSRAGFGISAIDNISLDSMISVITTDRTMWSHRFGIFDTAESQGIFSSVHIPFANDEKTMIKTWMIPLAGGQHIRVHKITLSQEYYIGEGGFAVPMFNDLKSVESKENEMIVSSDRLSSQMKVYSELDLKLSYREIQPGYHLYAPLAGYPYYETVKPCPPGEYMIAARFSVATKKEEGDDPYGR